jgi:hypothetical protein
VFYDISSGQVSNAYGGNFPFGRSRFLSGPLAYPYADDVLAIPEFLPTEPNGAYATHFDPELKLPYTVQWNATIEQSLGTSQSVTAGYVGAAGRRLYRTNVTLNPNEDFGDVREVTNGAESSYHALQLQWRHSLSNGLQGLASYTYAHSTDTASVDLPFGFTVPEADVTGNRGPSDFDIRHAFSGALTYAFPPTSGAAFSGTSVDLLYRAYSAPPVDVFNNTPTFHEVRPDVVPGVAQYLYGSEYPGGRRINPDAFAPVAEDHHGSLGRNALRGFAAAQLDLAIRRRFALPASTVLQVSVEFFNVSNRPNFASPVANLDDTTNFGLSTQMLNRGLGGLNPLYQLGGPRSIQLGARLQF